MEKPFGHDYHFGDDSDDHDDGDDDDDDDEAMVDDPQPKNTPKQTGMVNKNNNKKRGKTNVPLGPTADELAQDSKAVAAALEGRVNFSALRLAVEHRMVQQKIETSRRQSNKVHSTKQKKRIYRLVVNQDKKTESWLVQEKRMKNTLDREEGIAVQYLALGGHRVFIDSGETSDQSPDRIVSSLHAGPGQQTFGWSQQQRSDLALFYFGSVTDGQPSRLYFHNHHGSYWHYKGHQLGCPQYQHRSGSFSARASSDRADQFKMVLAEVLTNVAPHQARFYYSITTSCDLFHGSDSSPIVPGFKIHPLTQSPVNKYATATTALLYEKNTDFLESFKAARMSETVIKQQILSGKMTGFVTLVGGRESVQTRTEDPAGSRFGFCVQRYAPSSTDISNYTKKQVSEVMHIRSRSDVNNFINKQQPRTLNSGTFHSEETISTSYLQWLMKARGFHAFKITHFMAYRFADYPKDFLEPILQTRHECKQKGDVVAAECLKLVGNGSFGYNGLEASNYSRLRLMTHANLLKRRRKDMATLSVKHLTLVGLVRVAIKKPRLHPDGRQKRRREDASVFVQQEAIDDDDDDDEENRSEVNSEEETLREIQLVMGLESEADSEGEKNKAWELQPLYAVEIGGSERALFNNLPKAVAVLSNSKRLFFPHLNVMFRCLDPRLAELCYIDTDSCIWSFTWQQLEDNILPDKMDEWRKANVIADEEGIHSCHGKMKLEGTYTGALFKTAKIYRLFEEKNELGEAATIAAERYTRCKGVNRWIANRFEDSIFDCTVRNRIVVHRTCLRPTRTGEMLINHESRSLAVPFNFKRRVVGLRGIHTLAFSEDAPEEDDDADDVNDNDDDDDEFY